MVRRGLLFITRDMRAVKLVKLIKLREPLCLRMLTQVLVRLYVCLDPPPVQYQSCKADILR